MGHAPKTHSHTRFLGPSLVSRSAGQSAHALVRLGTRFVRRKAGNGTRISASSCRRGLWLSVAPRPVSGRPSRLIPRRSARVPTCNPSCGTRLPRPALRRFVALGSSCGTRLPRFVASLAFAHAHVCWLTCPRARARIDRKHTHRPVRPNCVECRLLLPCHSSPLPCS